MEQSVLQSLMHFSVRLPLIEQSEFYANLMYRESSPGWVGNPTLKRLHAKLDPSWESDPLWQIRLPALEGHPTYHVNVIN